LVKKNNKKRPGSVSLVFLCSFELELLAAQYLTQNRLVHSVVLVAASEHRCWVGVWTFNIADTSVSVHHCTECSTVVCMVRKQLLLVALTYVVCETTGSQATETSNGQWVRRVAVDCVLLDASNLSVVKLGRTIEQRVLVDAVNHLGRHLLSAAETLSYRSTETLNLVCEALSTETLSYWSAKTLNLVCEALSTEVLGTGVATVRQGLAAETLRLVCERLSAETLRLVCEALVHAAHVQWVLEALSAILLRTTVEQGRLLDALDLWVVKLGRTVKQRVLVDAVDHLSANLLRTALNTKTLCAAEALRLVCETLSAETLSYWSAKTLSYWSAKTLNLVCKALSTEVLGTSVATVRQGLAAESLSLVCERLSAETLRLVCETLVHAAHVQWVLEVVGVLWLRTTAKQGCLLDALDLWVLHFGCAAAEDGVLVDAVDHLRVDLLTTAKTLSAAEALYLVREALSAKTLSYWSAKALNLVCETLSTEVLRTSVATVRQGLAAETLRLVCERLSAETLRLVCEALAHAAHVQWVLEVCRSRWLGATAKQGRLLDALDLWVVKLRRTVEQRVLVDAIDHLGIYLLSAAETLSGSLVVEPLSGSLVVEPLSGSLVVRN